MRDQAEQPGVALGASAFTPGSGRPPRSYGAGAAAADVSPWFGTSSGVTGGAPSSCAEVQGEPGEPAAAVGVGRAASVAPDRCGDWRRSAYPSTAAFTEALRDGPVMMVLCEQDRETADAIEAWIAGRTERVRRAELARGDWRDRFPASGDPQAAVLPLWDDALYRGDPRHEERPARGVQPRTRRDDLGRGLSPRLAATGRRLGSRGPRSNLAVSKQATARPRTLSRGPGVSWRTCRTSYANRAASADSSTACSSCRGTRC